MTIAKTILEQLGGNRFAAMTGANNFVDHGNALNFKVPRVGYVRIELTPADTYKMIFMKIRGSAVKIVKEYDDVYCDQLQAIFTQQTGLYTKF